MSGATWAIFMMTFNLPTNTKTSAVVGRVVRQRAPRLPYELMNATHRRPHASTTVRRLARQRMHAIVSGFIVRVSHGAF